MNKENYTTKFIFYVIKFAMAFCICYFGTKAVIGLSAPGNYYSVVIDHYFNYVTWLRASLLYGSSGLLAVFGIKTAVVNEYILQLVNGKGVRIVYSCIGYGVMSFWIAFIFANKGNWLKKLKWITGGLFLIWSINILRISLLLIAVNKHWQMPLGLDHHTWFNIAAYGLIFIMIYFFDKSSNVKGRLRVKA